MGLTCGDHLQALRIPCGFRAGALRLAAQCSPCRRNPGGATDTGRSTDMSTKTRRSNTRKVVGSLAIAGTAAAVAGLGTFGTFTDSTTPVATTVQTGTLDINLNQPSGAYTVPVTTANFVSGDSITRAVNLSNDGTTSLSSVSLTSVSTGASNALTT